jgi:hypothetical protein
MGQQTNHGECAPNPNRPIFPVFPIPLVGQHEIITFPVASSWGGKYQFSEIRTVKPKALSMLTLDLN